MTHEKEENMKPPEEKKGTTCTHVPAEWMDCPRCIEDFYLEKLTTEQRVRAELERSRAEPGRLLREAGALLLDQPAQPASSRGERKQPAPPIQNASAAPWWYARLFDLVEIWTEASASGTWYGRGKIFSVLKEVIFYGPSPDEVMENVLIAALNELEAQKVALEAHLELKDAELEQTKKALLGAEYEADHLDTSWRWACLAAQNERLARRELLASVIGRKEAEADLPDFLTPAARRPSAARAETGASMLKAFRNAVAEAEEAKAHAEELRALAEGADLAKDVAYAERNELAVLVATMARALRLRAGWRLDPSAEKGWQTLVVVELPAGQVSWHLPDSEQGLADGLPMISEPWDGHTKAEARQRIRNAIFGGFKPAPEIGARTPLSWRADLLAIAPKRVDEAPCWCSLDWRGLLPDNHEEICLRLTQLLRKMIEAEGGQS